MREAWHNGGNNCNWPHLHLVFGIHDSSSSVHQKVNPIIHYPNNRL